MSNAQGSHKVGNVEMREWIEEDGGGELVYTRDCLVMGISLGIVLGSAYCEIEEHRDVSWLS